MHIKILYIGLIVFFAFVKQSRGNDTLRVEKPAAITLPVMMDGWVIYKKDQGVQLEWSNLTELDVEIYKVERSANGVDFKPICEFKPKENNNGKASYTAFDEKPLSGNNYYRIYVMEKAGKPFYSRILKVDMSTTQKGFMIYPVPVTGNHIWVQLTNLKLGPYLITIANLSGQIIYQESVKNYGTVTTTTIPVPPVMRAGMYVINVAGVDYRESKNIVVK